MSKTMSLRLTDEQLDAVQRWGRHRNQRSVSATLQMLLEEKLRQERFPGIVFRDTGIGRQAFVVDTGLGVWEIMLLLRAYNGSTVDVAGHLQAPSHLVDVAVKYADAYDEEIRQLIDDHDSVTLSTPDLP